MTAGVRRPVPHQLREDLNVIHKNPAELAEIRLVARQLGKQRVIRLLGHDDFQIVEPGLERQQQPDIAVDHDAAKPERQHIWPARQ